ncbi:MAG: DedA family protein [Thermoguttaceae bacterium]
MDFLQTLFNLFIHLDRTLEELIPQYGTWIYAILFLVIFCETGLVVTPFLPGDSLLFVAGTCAGKGLLDLTLLVLPLALAAIAGDTVNYWVGAYVGPRAFTGEVRFLKKEYLDRTHRFFEKHGGKTIVLARFIPIIRTFAPFVAGVGTMSYGRFLSYNVFGGIVWVVLFVGGGYLFGNIPLVRDHFSLVVLAIVGVSVLPIGIEMVRARLRGPEPG